MLRVQTLRHVLVTSVLTRSLLFLVRHLHLRHQGILLHHQSRVEPRQLVHPGHSIILKKLCKGHLCLQLVSVHELGQHGGVVALAVRRQTRHRHLAHIHRHVLLWRHRAASDSIVLQADTFDALLLSGCVALVRFQMVEILVISVATPADMGQSLVTYFSKC